MKASPMQVTGRVLQALGMGIVLVGIVESIFVGFAESESLRSMSLEVTYLAIGGAVFAIGLLLARVAGK